MNVKKYWENAVSFDKYVVNTEKIASLDSDSLSPEEKSMQAHYQMGSRRMNRIRKSYQPDESLIKKWEKSNFDGKILIISEGWCADASMIVPVVGLFFKDKNEVRVVYRDENPELIDMFLTNGGRAIPIILILDKDENVIGHWGPRPAYGKELLRRHKENPEEYPKDRFHSDVQVYYTKNKGFDIINEILELI